MFLECGEDERLHTTVTSRVYYIYLIVYTVGGSWVYDNAMNNYDFYKDLTIGHKAEEEVLKRIQKKYPKANRIEGYNKGYDIEVPEKEILIEVKHDVKAKETDNYFIEYECNEKESGVETTQADWWVIHDDEQIVWIRPGILKYIATSGRIYTIPKTGNNPETKGWLVKRGLILRSPYVNVEAL